MEIDEIFLKMVETLMGEDAVKRAGKVKQICEILEGEAPLDVKTILCAVIDTYCEDNNYSMMEMVDRIRLSTILASKTVGVPDGKNKDIPEEEK